MIERFMFGVICNERLVDGSRCAFVIYMVLLEN